MKKKFVFMLLLPIFLIIVSAVALFSGIKENNNTAIIVGYILLAIVNLLSTVIGFIIWNKRK